ncbi:D-aspartate oxidase [Daphnia magna]|uniref:D-aspartate oxidase n=1 Tax=Daphnia magna TaxID=35525 RepID=A0A0P5VHX5_9CRUS|nr:D-aspartate oxidase [Daphnia magna]
MVVKVAVIGAGIVGLSVAKVLQERFPNLPITLLADKFSPGTTSDGAAGLWMPFLLGDTPESDVYAYSKDTWDFLKELWNSPSGGKLGVSLVPCLQTSDTVSSIPSYSDFIYGFQVLKREELALYKKPQWKQGYRFVTFTCEGSRLMPHLMEQFRRKGGNVVVKRLECFEELASDFDVIINCSGIGAKELANDLSVHPIRGHIFRIKAPWQKSILIDDSDVGNYIIPNQDSVVLGGTHDKDQWDTIPRKEDAKFILEGCTSLFPSLEKAEILYEWVGLRPGRSQLRVELEKKMIDGKPLTVIHNYGHGGSGLTTFYGCALKVANLLEGILTSENYLASKL